MGNSKSSNMLGGVSYESARDAYRGSVTINGVRHRTKRFATRLGARRALNQLIKSLQTTPTLAQRLGPALKSSRSSVRATRAVRPAKGSV
jgi:hypothetical protein